MTDGFLCGTGGGPLLDPVLGAVTLSEVLQTGDSEDAVVGGVGGSLLMEDRDGRGDCSLEEDVVTKDGVSLRNEPRATIGGGALSCGDDAAACWETLRTGSWFRLSKLVSLLLVALLGLEWLKLLYPKLELLQILKLLPLNVLLERGDDDSLFSGMGGIACVGSST